MLDLLVVEDHPDLLDSLAGRARGYGIEKAAFASSYDDALRLIKTYPIQRVVSDNVFEGEAERGVQLLQEARRRNPTAILNLLTGQPLREHEIRDAEQARVRIIPKGKVNVEIIDHLLFGLDAGPLEGAPRETQDVALLVLEKADLEKAYKELSVLTDSMIDDIYEEVGKYPANTPVLVVGREQFTKEDLRRHIEDKTSLGRQLINLHRNLNRRLRAAKGE
jgi:CheY-like chemotaxis protein